jgi:hypothetical protein
MIGRQVEINQGIMFLVLLLCTGTIFQYVTDFLNEIKQILAKEEWRESRSAQRRIILRILGIAVFIGSGLFSWKYGIEHNFQPDHPFQQKWNLDYSSPWIILAFAFAVVLAGYIYRNSDEQKPRHERIGEAIRIFTTILFLGVWIAQ